MTAGATGSRRQGEKRCRNCESGAEETELYCMGTVIKKQYLCSSQGLTVRRIEYGDKTVCFMGTDR